MTVQLLGDAEPTFRLCISSETSRFPERKLSNIDIWQDAFR